MFALVDCNNFYASCERVFNPRLEGKPVVVLSNNDGCVISRSQEAKQIGVPMGAAYFKWREFCEKNNVFVFSSNYELYGDMSYRVMQTLKQHAQIMEIYSIDEAFLFFEGFSAHDLYSHLVSVRKIVKQWTGLPVSIGIGETKTLAKIANSIAKKTTAQSVYGLYEPSIEDELAKVTIDRIWGVGSQLQQKLRRLNIHTALDLRNSDSKMIRLHFSVVVEKIVQELCGISCLPLESVSPRKQIICSRSFGKTVTELYELEEAVSYYSVIACEKLRKQHCLASSLGVFLETNFFRKQDPQHHEGVFFPFPIATADTADVIRIAKKCVKHLYKKGYRYHKAGIMLVDLVPAALQQQDFFQKPSEKKKMLLQTIDDLNQDWGRETVFYAATGMTKAWQMQCNRRSPRYTTRWDELASVK